MNIYFSSSKQLNSVKDTNMAATNKILYNWPELSLNNAFKKFLFHKFLIASNYSYSLYWKR